MRAAVLGRVGDKVPRTAPTSLRALIALAAITVAATLHGCRAADRADDAPRLTGTQLEVVAVWQETEAAAFRQVLDRFERRTGAEVRYSSTAGEDLTAVLDRRLDAGDPPDLAVLPQPGLLGRYARRGQIQPIGDLVGAEVASGWAPVWRRLGTVDGRLYGVWFKAANKSLVWYSLRAFETAGVVPPDDLAGFATVARTLAERGIPPFSVTSAPSDAWTFTDWFENLYLRLAGPDRYDQLAGRRIPWTHPTVEETLRAMAELLPRSHLALADGDDTTFPESVDAVFAPRPQSAMVVEGDFVPGVAGGPEAEIGIDVDVFDFPGRDAADRFVVGGGDAAVLMRRSAGSDALLRYLASAEAAEVWAGLGGFLSPNEEVGLGAYPDPATRRIARALLDAGDQFRFDLSDLQPVGFGGATDAGLWTELRAFLADPTDVDGTMARLEAAARAAWEGG